MAVDNATLLAKASALEKRANDTASTLKDAQTTIASLQSQITSLLNHMQPLITAANITFLAGLSEMTPPGDYPLPTDSGSGSYWITGERGYVNSSINDVNLLVQKFQRNGYMST